ncbi:type I-E CRISPR-associated endoribonuclease Cas2e [Neoactinobaculum massilliense]|uniref:type I-E CRISPR-associated endoribonuclease Cas2e n=1 Tax=Neoactinobaculum massilliense TaxID=2364794 RepID=UPI000F51EBBC|nr:type I-E CRISPR-associated endoribonuclease Cas2e [Neoactinobaculum massilliense]
MFAVISVRAVPDYLHGYLSRFLSEADTGLYVGVLSARVADYLWLRCMEATGNGAATMVTSAPGTEQGFSVRSVGKQSRPVLTIDGLLLMSTVSQAESVQPRIDPNADRRTRWNEGSRHV